MKNAKIFKNYPFIVVIVQKEEKSVKLALYSEINKMDNVQIKGGGCFYVGKTDKNIQRLKELRFLFTGDAAGSDSICGGDDEDNFSPTVPQKELPRNDLPSELYPYQVEGVQFLEAVWGRAVLGDEPGLGKTPQTCAWLALHRDAFPTLVVCPASLQINWIRELKRWGNLDAELWKSGKKSDVYIISYDLLRHRIEDLIQTKWNCIITDECQYLMSMDTQRWKAFEQICDVRYRIAVSGTPIKSNTAQFFPTLNWVAPEIFNSKAKYHQEFCELVSGFKGMEFKGSKNLGKLHRMLTPIMIRRLKKDVLKQLPLKRKNIVPLMLEDTLAEDYYSEDAKFMEWVVEHQNEVLRTRSHLALLSYKAYLAKRNSLIEWVQEFLRVSPEKKLVLFAYHRKVMNDLFEVFQDICVRVDGSTTLKQRQNAVDLFQAEDGPRIFLGQVLASGTGITLTRASDVAFAQLWWNPSDVEQAEDRVHRLTQTADNVNVWFLVAPGSIEDDQAYVLQTKKLVTSHVLDGEEQEFFDENFLTHVLNRRKNRKNGI